MLAMGRAAYPPRGSSSARSLCGRVNVNALDDFVSCFGGWDRWRFRTSGAVAGSSFGECGPYRLGLAIYLIIKMSDPKTTRKAPSGVRTPSPATNGIAAFAVTASSTRRWYANTLLVSTTRPCRRLCTSTSVAQFGTERNSRLATLPFYGASQLPQNWMT